MGWEETVAMIARCAAHQRTDIGPTLTELEAVWSRGREPAPTRAEFSAPSDQGIEGWRPIEAAWEACAGG